jgi:hypothetical protein
MRGLGESRFSRLLSKLRNTRSYGGVTTKGPVTEHVLMPRGLIPAPANNYKIIVAMVAALCGSTGMIYLNYNMRNKRVKAKWDDFHANGFEHWKDFSNHRMSEHAKVLAEGPCGEQFKSAYLCALFPDEEGQKCGGEFESFAGCVSAQPEMMRPVRPDGEYNFESRHTLHRLGGELSTFRNTVDASGPADEDLDVILDDYRARFKLGPSASDAEVKSYQEKFHALSRSFWKEVTDLWEKKKTDGSEARKLYKQLLKEYSIPADVWLEVLKEYDVEEFDEAVTRARRKYGWLAHELKKFKVVATVSDVDLSNVTCGEDFGKLYRCLSERQDESDCADIVDELFFCRQHHTLQVWPYMKSFETKDKSFTAELERVSEILHNNPIID